MITVEEATLTLYRVCCTQPYRDRSHYTITDYSDDPTLLSKHNEFKTDVLLAGPAAKVYTPSGLLPK